MNQRQASKRLASYFDQWYSLLLRYAYGATGQLPVAEDLVQGTFFKLYRELRAGVEIAQPKAWLFCVLRNEIVKHRRAAGKRAQLSDAEFEEKLPASQPADPEPAPDGEDLQRLFSVLTNREQEVVLLRLASLKYREIAERLDLSPSSVNTLLARAIEKLRRAARKEGHGGGIRAGWDQRVPKTLQ